ncbi:MAG: Cna B-type domain-containing protein [Oscillospiraceae bacterium]|nr:Cna B-type domain-containing protein [Oscillospiraceae bacterium]
MKKIFKSGSALLLALVMALGLSVTAFAADSSITYKGHEDGFETQPGSEYTETDLFDNFKNVMPGDKLTQTIHFTNKAEDCDYINVYLKAVVHDENGNPLSEKVAETGETVATMQDFLKQLTMRIYNGSELIYNSTPDQTGALADNVFLGKLTAGEALSLKVELDVPVDLGNQYANRVGEVDWVFSVEAIENNKLTVHKVWDDNGYPNRPGSVKVNLLKDGKTAETVTLNADNQWTYTWDKLDDRYEWTVQEETPEGYEASYKKQDNTVFITNHKDYTPATPAAPTSPMDLTVKKVWSDENNKRGNRPDAVTVTLYNGDTAVKRVTLNAANNWTFTWYGLDSSANWSVLETGIPKGYTPSYSASGSVLTITNTESLIQTGQLNWPIPVLGSLGALMILCGILMMRRKKKNDEA